MFLVPLSICTVQIDNEIYKDYWCYSAIKKKQNKTKKKSTNCRVHRTLLLCNKIILYFYFYFVFT